MALKKDGQQPVKTAGAFETETETAAPKVSDEAAAKAGVAASTAVAKAGATSLLALTGKNALYGQLENAIPKLDFGVVPRLVAASGVIKDADKKSLGTTIDIELVSWNRNWVISPGDDSAEAKETVRYSSDGKSIDETGEDVAEYLDKLRGEGDYPKANVKEYLEVVGILEKSEKPTEHLGSLVMVSLAPSSRKVFEGFRLQESLKVARGKLSPEAAQKIRFTCDPKSFGGNDYTVLKPSVAVAV